MPLKFKKLKSILTFRKKAQIWNDSDENLETLNSDRKNDSSNHNNGKIKDHKVGMFPRLKKKFSMNRGNSTIHKKNLLKATTSKSDNFSEDSSKKLSIIHRSADGRFRPSSKSSSYQSNALNSSAAEKTAILRRHSTIVTTKDTGISSHRPISDCYGEIRAQTLLYAGLNSGTIQEEEEELIEDGGYEIDCSRSDIEVRCLSKKNSSMINQSIRHSMRPMRDYESVKLDFPKAHYISLKELSNHQAPFRFNSRLYLDSPPPINRWRHLENVYGTWSKRSQTRDRQTIDRQRTWTTRPHLLEPLQRTDPQASSDVVKVNDVKLEDSTLKPSVINSSNSMPSILPQPTNKCDVISAQPRRSVSGDNLSEVMSSKEKTSSDEVEKLEDEDQSDFNSLPTSRQNQDLSDPKTTRILNDVTSSSSGYESRNASASSSSESSASQLRHATLHCAEIPSLLRPASLSLKCDGTRDRLEEVKRSTTKLDALHLMHPENLSKRDTSSVDDKYEWDLENAIKSDILDALHNYRSHKNLTPQVKLNNISLDSSPAPREDPNLARDPFIDERCSENSEEDESYSKESMEKRCAALKKEYRQYKYFQKFNVDTTNC